MGRKGAIEYVKVDTEHGEQFKVVMSGKNLTEEEIFEFLQMCGRVAQKRAEYLRSLEEQEDEELATCETEIGDIENIKVGGTD